MKQSSYFIELLEKQKTINKIFLNSECNFCILKFKTPLRIITSSLTKKQVIACEDCINILKENAKKEKD